MSIRVFKYASPFLIYLGALQAFASSGFLVFLPLMYAFAIVPLLELFMPPDHRNFTDAEELMAKADFTYDILLYAIVPLQFFALYQFLDSVSLSGQTVGDYVGKTAVMGLLCGTFGINVGHELGHRTKRFEQLLAKTLLLSSLYMHFFIEHNKGHHKRVATPQDPGSARYGEPVFAFYIRSIVLSYKSAWKIAGRDQRKKGRPSVTINNEMLQFHLVQAACIVLLWYSFGIFATCLFLVAALLGILLLETVNYIEHYGLQRRQTGEGKWERAMPQHSWNSNHMIGRVMLFELSRHNDHHYLASRKYQILRHHENSPQMPTGYPGMMLLALFPPAWFYVMNRRIRKMNALDIAQVRDSITERSV